MQAAGALRIGRGGALSRIDEDDLGPAGRDPFGEEDGLVLVRIDAQTCRLRRLRLPVLVGGRETRRRRQSSTPVASFEAVGLSCSAPAGVPMAP